MNEATARSRMDVLKVEVLEAMREVKARGEALRAAVVNEAGYAWVWRDPDIERPTTETDRVFAAWAMTETDYIRDDQKPQDTLCAPGVITASARTMILIDQLNAARERFRTICAELKNAKIKVDGQHERLVTYWLRSHGFGRINRRQTYRHLVILEDQPNEPDKPDEPVRRRQPVKISFSWCAPSRMKTLSREQLRQLIQVGSGSDEAIERHLASLDATDDPAFVQVREASLAQPRVNVWFKGMKEPSMLTTPLPIAISDHIELPRIKPISEARVSPARERKWKKLVEAPFLPELAVHRYRQYAR